jgi:hypothetical protein
MIRALALVLLLAGCTTDLGDRGRCEADCHCYGAGPCINGACRYDLEQPLRGLCGRGGDCACAGGECSELGCCILPSGYTATPDSPECAGG